MAVRLRGMARLERASTPAREPDRFASEPPAVSAALPRCQRHCIFDGSTLVRVYLRKRAGVLSYTLKRNSTISSPLVASPDPRLNAGSAAA
jgi:hypothetical protein